MLLTEMISVQKSVVNHEHVMQNVMSYLHSADTFIRDQRRNSRLAGAYESGSGGDPNSTSGGLNSQLASADDQPPSPLQNAEKLLNDSSADTLLNNKNLEHMNELYRQNAGMISTPPPDLSRNGLRMAGSGAHAVAGFPHNPLALTKANGELQEAVYPAGQNNGIDPLYSEHINNIPYPMPQPSDLADASGKQFGEGRKKSTVVDPGWIRPPQILLVEDDPTCRRIGGKFLYSFKCAIDSAVSVTVTASPTLLLTIMVKFDGLEAVHKMNAGSKYDLVLMDIIMPNLDGISACSLIRNFDSTPIIAMTSNIRSDDISMYFQHGQSAVDRFERFILTGAHRDERRAS
jgi:osomolarity two-component system response regulator SKN7